MQISQLPTLLKLAFAALGGKNSIPVASQLPGNINGASYTDGFPPATRTAIAAGGKPPAGLDMNGVLFDLSSNVRWMNAGGPFPYSSTFATDANVGGYPQGAEIASADLEGTWISLNDNNTDNPDTGAGTKWVPGRAYGVTAVTGLTNVNVTLTPAQAAKGKITLAGTLTGNVSIIMPTWLKDWVVTNNTTGAFSLTCKTAAGAGVVIPQNGSPTKIRGDGTNIAQLAENVAPATLPQHAVQFGQLPGIVGSRTNLKASCLAAATTIAFTADAITVATGLIGLQYLLPSFSKTLNLATTGAGGMDTGTATAGAWLAVYAIYNPTTQTQNILGTLEVAAAAPTIYGGANMPVGYTASALLAVIRVSGTAGQLNACLVNGRRTSVSQLLTLQTSTTVGTATSFSLSGAVPKAAVRVSGETQLVSTSASLIGMALSSDSLSNIGYQNVSASGSVSLTGNWAMDILTTQTLYYSFTNSAGTPTMSLYVSAYEI